MKLIISLFFLLTSFKAFSLCSTVLSRNNYTTNQVLTSSALNTDFNQLVTKTNEIDGDCITDATLPRAKLETSAFNLTVTAVSATYSILTTDEVILATAGSAFTATLPTASGVTGKTYTIKKVDSSANAVTVEGLSTETIDGALFKTLSTVNESIRVVSDGTNWKVVSRDIPSAWASCGHVTGDFTDFGTVSAIETQCKREGDELLMKGNFTSGTPAAATTAKVGLRLNAVTLTSAGTGTIPTLQVAQGAYYRGLSNAAKGGPVLISPSVTYFTFGTVDTFSNNAANPLTEVTASSVSGGISRIISFNIRVQITGWED
jgi:hypothetical protein